MNTRLMASDLEVAGIGFWCLRSLKLPKRKPTLLGSLAGGRDTHTPRAVGTRGALSVGGSGSDRPADAGAARVRHASAAALVGCPSGQREQTVNLPASAYEGSNPSPTTRRAGVAQLVEHQPSKLRVAGSSPVARSRSRSSVGRARPW